MDFDGGRWERESSLVDVASLFALSIDNGGNSLEIASRSAQWLAVAEGRALGSLSVTTSSSVDPTNAGKLGDKERGWRRGEAVSSWQCHDDYLPACNPSAGYRPFEPSERERGDTLQIHPWQSYHIKRGPAPSRLREPVPNYRRVCL